MNEPTSLHTVEQRVRIAATPETVWTFWVDPRRMVEWWGTRAELVAEEGGIFRVEMGDDGPTMRGEYLELEPHTRLVFSFGWEQEPLTALVPPCSSRVEVLLVPDGDHTEVLLAHSLLPVEAVEEHRKGWAEFAGERLPAAARRSDAP